VTAHNAVSFLRYRQASAHHKPEAVADAFPHLAGAGFVTGQQLIVDGGMSVKMIYEE